MYIFCGLTHARKTSNGWVSPQAKIHTRDEPRPRIALQQKQPKKLHNVWRRHKSPFKVHL